MRVYPLLQSDEPSHFVGLTEEMDLINRINARVLDAVWLLLLGAYLFAGMMLVPFHPDETEHIRMSKDYVTLFVERDPAQMMDVINPETGSFRDKESGLRVIDAPLHSYAVGFAWTLGGLSVDDLPPFWEWEKDYQTNTAEGKRPIDPLLASGRAVSTLMLFGSVVLLFFFGWQIDGRWTAYLVSLLYTINPAVLTHGRRAMHEAPLLFLGTLTLLIAALIAQRIAQRKPVSGVWWGSLVIAAGLTIAGKHSGIFLVGAAFAWILFAEILKPLCARDRQGVARTLLTGVARFGLYGLLAVGIFIVLNPGLWSNPPGLLQKLFSERTAVINIQASSIPNALETLPQRFEAIVTFPLIHRDTSAHDAGEGRRYFPSLLAGQPFDNLLGWLLTLLAGVGLLVTVRRAWQTEMAARTFYTGLVIWLGVLILLLLTNPLPWQRYYVPLIPAMTLLIGVAAHSLWNWLKMRTLARYVETPV